MDKINITNDKILELEFIHDNKDDLDIINNNICYDMINRKIIKIDTSNNKPEETMKEYIFQNINYKNLNIVNTPYQNNIIPSDKTEFNDNIILIFDNMQLKHENINILQYIFKDKNVKIFIPFVYIAEQLLTNTKQIKMKNKIKDFKKANRYIFEVITDNYFTTTNTLIDFYNKEAEDIGFYYDDKDDKLINYNIFSKSKETKENKDKNIHYQLQILYKYLKKFNLRDKRKHFYKNIQNLITSFETNFVENNNVKNITTITALQTIILNNIKAFIISLKEARDTYYLLEIKRLMANPLYNNSQLFYITTDEITNCRCILEKISSINILGDIPRYIISVKENKIILKLFNIFQNLIKVTDTNNEIYKLIENVRKINSQQVLTNTKNLLLKEYSGGYYKEEYNNDVLVNNKKIDYFTFNFDTIIKHNIIKYNKMEDNLPFIKNKDYKSILYYLYDVRILFFDSLLIFRDEYNDIIEISNKNKKYIDVIQKCKNIFDELIYLYDTINPLELVSEFEKIYKEQITEDGESGFNENGEYIGYTNTYNSDNNSENDLDLPYMNDFINTIKLTMTHFYEEYKQLTKKTINSDKWNGLYCAWLINLLINYHDRESRLKFYKFIFPDLFDKYPIEELIILLNIRTEYHLRQKNKDCDNDSDDNSD